MNGNEYTGPFQIAPSSDTPAVNRRGVAVYCCQCTTAEPDRSTPFKQVAVDTPDGKHYAVQMRPEHEGSQNVDIRLHDPITGVERMYIPKASVYGCPRCSNRIVVQEAIQ